MINEATSESLFRQAVADGIQAARRNRFAGIALWIFGCAIITGYYFVPAFRELLEQVAEWKIRWGFLFSAISTALFGGLIPALIQMLVKRTQSGDQPHYVLSDTLFWAVKGIEIDLLYRLQAMLFGEGSTWHTVAIKTTVDQFLYVPAFGLVNVILFYLWRESRYDCGLLRRELGPRWYRQRVLPVLIANWTIWIPAVVLIYCFPLALQLPVQNLILCFWILMLKFLTSKTEIKTGS
ncbi:MAG: Mpv17/PMP22 family protein [Pirellulaceae bacterium]